MSLDNKARAYVGLGTASRQAGILSKVSKVGELVTPRISCVQYSLNLHAG